MQQSFFVLPDFIGQTGGKHVAAVPDSGGTFGVDHLYSTLRAFERKFAVHKSAAGKLTSFCRGSAFPETRPQHPLYNGDTAVHIKLRHVFPGERTWGGIVYAH